MHQSFKYLGLIFVTAALSAPLATRSRAAQEVVVREGGDHHRYYDRNHHDYHEWNDREDRSFRVYLGEQHRDYRGFDHENSRQQRAYWNWRHSHPD
jgi:hypothetical protein